MTAVAAISPRRLVRQGVLLLGGSVGTQLLGFARNALLAHGLSRGDFGIAAALLLTLQLVETSTEVAADRYIVQAPPGGAQRAMAAGHTMMILRGLVCTIALAALAQPIARLFSAPHATTAFLVVALVPLLRGFQHLDARRRQRHLDNRASVLVEIAPQAVALALCVPVLMMMPTYEAAVALVLAQALATLVASHWLACRPYRLTRQRAQLAPIFGFAWPLWAAGLPTALVLHGERGIIGAVVDVHALAGFAAAAMVVAALSAIAARLGQALILPALVAARGNEPEVTRRLSLATDVSTAAAATITVGAIVAGPLLMPLLFGAPYSDMGAVLGWLTLGAALRILQAPVSLLHMAEGRTGLFLAASSLRATALLVLAALAAAGVSLDHLALASALSEITSFAVFALSARHRADVVRATLQGALWLLAAALLGLAIGPGATIAALTVATVAAATLAAMGAVLALLRYRTAASPPAAPAVA